MSEGMKVSLIHLVIGTLETFRLGDCLPTNRMKQKRSVFDIIQDLKTDHETIGLSQSHNKQKDVKSKYKLNIMYVRKWFRKSFIEEAHKISNYQLKKSMEELVQTLKSQKYQSLLTSI